MAAETRAPGVLARPYGDGVQRLRNAAVILAADLAPSVSNASEPLRRIVERRHAMARPVRVITRPVEVERAIAAKVAPARRTMGLTGCSLSLSCHRHRS